MGILGKEELYNFKMGAVKIIFKKSLATLKGKSLAKS